MEQRAIEAVNKAAEKKLNFAKTPARYVVYAAMAGCFCTLGMALAYTMGAGFYYTEALRGAYKLAIGGTFTLSFTLIIFAGAELFTSNVMVMSMGVLSRRVRIGQGVRLLVLCYAANMVGALLMGWMVASSGLLAGETGDLIVMSAATKMALPFTQALVRGILCNVMVCLGIWGTFKVKSETAKMVLLFWVVLGFAGTGYEHSIANFGLFTMALLSPQAGAGVTLAGAAANLIPVTLGNLAGGAVLVGWTYWFAGRETEYLPIVEN